MSLKFNYFSFFIRGVQKCSFLAIFPVPFSFSKISYHIFAHPFDSPLILTGNLSIWMDFPLLSMKWKGKSCCWASASSMQSAIFTERNFPPQHWKFEIYILKVLLNLKKKIFDKFKNQELFRSKLSFVQKSVDAEKEMPRNLSICFLSQLTCAIAVRFWTSSVWSSGFSRCVRNLDRLPIICSRRSTSIRTSKSETSISARILWKGNKLFFNFWFSKRFFLWILNSSREKNFRLDV